MPSSFGHTLGFALRLGIVAAASLVAFGAGCGGGGGGGGPVPAPPGSGAGTGSGTGSGTTGGSTPAGPVPGQLLAGAASSDITPGPGAPLGGFGGDPRRVINLLTVPLMLAEVFGAAVDPDPRDAVTYFAPNQGVHDPLTAKAIVLSDGVEKYAIVKLDAIGLSRLMYDGIAQVAASLGIPQQNLMVCATHTHGGPGAVSEQKLWQLIAMDHFNPQLFQATVAKIGDALARADAALAPAQLAVGSGIEVTASRNRRGRPGVFDPEVGVFRIERLDGTPVCALFNFAVHGTALGAGNLQYTADVHGYAERYLEQQLGSGAVAIFTNGAEGDVSPSAGGYSGAEQVGRIIGDRVLAVWNGLTPAPSIHLDSTFEDVPFPHPQASSGCLPVPGTSTDLCNLIPNFPIGFVIPLSSDWLSTVLPFQAIRINRSVLASVPGEPITDIGFDIKTRGKAKGFDYTFVVGLANDHMGYVTDAREFARGLYEAQATLYGPHTGPLVVDAVDRQMERVKP